MFYSFLEKDLLPSCPVANGGHRNTPHVSIWEPNFAKIPLVEKKCLANASGPVKVWYLPLEILRAAGLQPTQRRYRSCTRLLPLQRCFMVEVNQLSENMMKSVEDAHRQHCEPNGDWSRFISNRESVFMSWRHHELFPTGSWSLGQVFSYSSKTEVCNRKAWTK